MGLRREDWAVDWDWEQADLQKNRENSVGHQKVVGSVEDL